MTNSSKIADGLFNLPFIVLAIFMMWAWIGPMWPGLLVVLAAIGVKRISEKAAGAERRLW